jgi:hypothetical protein
MGVENRPATSLDSTLVFGRAAVPKTCVLIHYVVCTRRFPSSPMGKNKIARCEAVQSPSSSVEPTKAWSFTSILPLGRDV